MQFSWQFSAKEPMYLKSFLNQHGVSHRLFLKLKKQQLVKVNQTAVLTNLKLMANDFVTIDLPTETADPEVVVSNGSLDVLFEDENWLVINKPAGLTSVPGPSNRTDTLVNRVKGHLLKQGAINLRPHLITRLDRFTSGIVLIAKHQLANSIAAKMVQKNEIEKTYVAVVSGVMQEDHGLVDQPIGRIGDQVRRSVMQNGQPSVTEYWVMARGNDWTGLRIKLHTGRTHQIRVHMSFLGHPLLGDQLYGGPLVDGFEHQALDAHWLSFNDVFIHQKRHFKTVLPNNIKQLIDNNGGH